MEWRVLCATAMTADDPRRDLPSRAARAYSLSTPVSSLVPALPRIVPEVARASLVRVARLLPLDARLELRRALTAPRRRRERAVFARARLSRRGLGLYPHALVELHSPIARPGASYSAALQRGKARNVRRVARALDRVVVAPGETLSYHQLVGWPSRLRGFHPGPEMRGGELVAGVGGGACQVANMLFQLGLLAGLEVVERHRHGRDLSPDYARTMPFGAGATVFFGLADLKLRNPHEHPILLRLEVREGELRGSLRAPQPPTRRYSIAERGHRFLVEGAQTRRVNELLRLSWTLDGRLLGRELVARNEALVAYPYHPRVFGPARAG